MAIPLQPTDPISDYVSKRLTQQASTWKGVNSKLEEIQELRNSLKDVEDYIKNEQHKPMTLDKHMELQKLKRLVGSIQETLQP